MNECQHLYGYYEYYNYFEDVTVQKIFSLEEINKLIESSSKEETYLVNYFKFCPECGKKNEQEITKI